MALEIEDLSEKQMYVALWQLMTSLAALAGSLGSAFERPGMEMHAVPLRLNRSGEQYFFDIIELPLGG